MTRPSIGTTLAVSATGPATDDAAGYGALTFTEVGSVESIGERGDTHEDITFTDLKTGRTGHVKGAADGGSFTVTCHTEDYANTGQDMVRTAAAADDTPTATLWVAETDRAGNIDYYEAVFADYRNQEASGSSYESCSFSLRVNSARITVEA